MSSDYTTDTKNQKIANFTSFDTPFDALVNDLPVSILGVCDWEDHSPAYLTIDSNGRTGLAAVSSVTVIDRRVTPNQYLSRGMAGAGSSSR